MRVVADANIFVSAALGRSPESPSVRIIDAALDGRIELVMSPALLEEIADVLARPRIRRRLSAEDARRRDPDDDYLVALADRPARLRGFRRRGGLRRQESDPPTASRSPQP